MEILAVNHARERESFEAKIAELDSAEKDAKLRDFELECEISKLKTDLTCAARKLDESREKSQQFLQQQLHEREKLALMKGESEVQQRQLATLELNYQELEKSFCELTRSTHLMETELARLREDNLRLRTAELSLHQQQAKKEPSDDTLRVLIEELGSREMEQSRIEVRLTEVEREREALTANVKDLENMLTGARKEMDLLRSNRNHLRQMHQCSMTEEEFAQSDFPFSLDSDVARPDFCESNVESTRAALENVRLQSVICSMDRQNTRLNSLIVSLQENVKVRDTDWMEFLF